MKTKEMRGITLISLVVSIIILLILSGITISALSGENGILNKTAEAKQKSQESQEIEKIKLAISGIAIGNMEYEQLDENSLQNEIDKEFGSQEVKVSKNPNNSILINFKNSGNTYCIDDKIKKVDIYISTQQDLKKFRDDVNSGNTYEGKYIYLLNDIELDGNEQWKPIGLYPKESTGITDNEHNKAFKGTFDGGGYTIDGINTDTTERGQGLFGLVDNAKIINLKIGEKSNIIGGASTGGVCGYMYNNSEISNCSNNANVTGSIFVGGIVGYSKLNCNIYSCENNGNIITNTNTVGGICSSNSGKIEKCYNSGKINAKSYGASGICYLNNENEDVKILKCYNLGEILTSQYASGICGVNTGSIEECFNKADIKATGNAVSGITNENNKLVKNCYNIGNIEGIYNTGAIIGNNKGGECTNCYNSGDVISKSNIETNGFIGKNDNGKYTNCFFDSSKKIEGKTYDIEGIQFISMNEIIKGIDSLGKDFKEDKDNINNGYPILSWQ